MTDKTDSKERDAFEAWAQKKRYPYQVTRRGNSYWDAFSDAAWQAWQARASLAANAGSEPVAQAKGVFEFWWADHMPNATQAEAWREWCELMRPGPVAVAHPSPPEGMVGGWIASKDQMPPPGVRVFWGDVDSHRVGYDSWAGDDYRWAPSHWMHIPEFPAPPTSSADSRKGE